MHSLGHHPYSTPTPTPPYNAAFKNLGKYSNFSTVIQLLVFKLSELAEVSKNTENWVLFYCNRNEWKHLNRSAPGSYSVKQKRAFRFLSHQHLDTFH